MDLAEVMPKVSLGFTCPCGYDNSFALARLVEVEGRIGHKGIAVSCERCKRVFHFAPAEVLNVKPCYEVAGVHLPLSKVWASKVQPPIRHAVVRYDGATIDTWPHDKGHAPPAKGKGEGKSKDAGKNDAKAAAPAPGEERAPKKERTPKKERAPEPPRREAAPKRAPEPAPEAPPKPAKRWWEFWKS